MKTAAILMAAACATSSTGVTDAGVDPDTAPPVDGSVDTRVAWSVSRHVWPTDAKAAVSTDLALIAELGAKFVRTDVWWYAVEGTRGQLDAGALAYYRWYVEEAQRHGLGVVVILSNPPEWAKQLYNDNKRTELAAAFGNYSERVAATVGDLVTYYQLWNEPNNVVDLPDADMDAQLVTEGRAGVERGRAVIGATRPLRTIVNMLVDGHDGPVGARWEDDIRYLFSHGAAPAIDIISIDHYPGTWSVGDWGGNILDRLFALGDDHDKAVAIFEAGYATSRCVPPFNTEEGQASWIREQVPRIRGKITDPAVTRGVRFELVNWFKLEDRNTGNCFDPEDNFGIVRTDRSKKPAFAALAGELAKF